MHGKKILKLLQKIFSWLPLATVINDKVLVVHGGISNSTDLNVVSRVDRHRVRRPSDPLSVCFVSIKLKRSQVLSNLQYVSVLRPPKVVHQTLNGNRNEGDNGPAEGRRRVRSLTNHSSALPQRNSLPRRSLQNSSISHQLSSSVEDELKRRRRLAGFDQTYKNANGSDSDSDPDFAEAPEANGHDWKQVRYGDNICV